jgi:hypothetical protein
MRQLWTYNFGVHDLKTGEGIMHIWDESTEDHRKYVRVWNTRYLAPTRMQNDLCYLVTVAVVKIKTKPC